MSFISALKSAFGFGSSTDDSELLADTASETAASTGEAEIQVPSPVEFNETHREAIFKHVVEVFNSVLPGFLADSVDPVAQQKRLYDALDQGIKEYVESLDKAARDYCEAAWQARQAGMARELEEARKRSGEVEQKASNLKQQQLSADRQKRALSERVHDLEQQRATMEAEIEQYVLENRSLMSRLKASGVHSEDVERMRGEMEELRQQLNDLRRNPDSEIAKVREELTKQLNEAIEGNESLKEQVRVATEMLEDMRRRHREASNLASKKDEEIKGLKATIAENLRLHTEREDELQREINALRPPTVVNEMTVDFGTAEDAAPRISEDDLSAIEETFETGEWFTASPLPETPSMRPSETEQPFGYTAPQRRKNQPENPAQLSLF